VVLLSIYRGYMAVKELSSKVSRWAPTVPKITVTEASFAAPQLRTTGLVLRVKGTKSVDFELPSDTPVRVYIRNSDEFWRVVEQNLGSTAADMSHMMPVAVAPKYFRPETIRAGDTAVDLTFDFDVPRKTASLAAALAALNCVHVQVEYGAHEGTLFNLQIKFATLEQTTVQPWPLLHEQSERLFDVMWFVALTHFVMLFVDLVTVFIPFIALHINPARVYRVYCRGLD
jgi:hypothetical protein